MRKKRVVVIMCLLLVVALAFVVAWQFLHVDNPAVGDDVQDDNQQDIPVPEIPHEHAWGDWIVETLPSCVDLGQEQRDCDCGETQRRDIAALGHDFVSGYCSRCGEVDPTYDFSCKHENTSGLIFYPTCTENGRINVSCSDCGELISSEITPALGHDFVDGYCIRCSEIDPNYDFSCKHEHLSQLDYVEATCTQNGSYNVYCLDCYDLIRTETIPTLGHDYVDGVCSRCGAPDEVYYNNFVGYWFTDSIGFDSEEFGCYYFLIEKDEEVDGKYYFTRSGYKIEDGVVILYNNPTDYGSLQSFTYASVDGIKQFTVTRWEQCVDCSYDGEHLFIGDMVFYKTDKNILYDGTTTPITPL